MLELNKIYNEDCLEGMKKIPDESIDLVVTDPPYKITSRGTNGTTGGLLCTKLSKQGKIFKYNDIEFCTYIPELFRVLKNGSHCYVMVNHVNLHELLNVATATGFKFIKSLIWDKGNKIMGRFYMSQFEFILFFRKGEGKQINNCGTSDILSIPIRKHKNENGGNIHDTEKPCKLMEILIENSSDINCVVLDPFMGSGTTAVACINTNRNFIGFELDKEYFDKANKRILHTNKPLF